MGVWSWLTDPANWTGPDGIPARTLEQIQMSAFAMALAAAREAGYRDIAIRRRGSGARDQAPAFSSSISHSSSAASSALWRSDSASVAFCALAGASA